MVVTARRAYEDPQRIEASRKASAVAQQLAGAVEDVRRVLRNASSGREAPWATALAEPLAELQESLRQHRDGVRGPRCEYELLCTDAEWLVPRIDRLFATFKTIEERAETAGVQLTLIANGKAELVPETRAGVRGVLKLLRQAQAEEASVEVERFNPPPALD